MHGQMYALKSVVDLKFTFNQASCIFICYIRAPYPKIRRPLCSRSHVMSAAFSLTVEQCGSHLACSPGNLPVQITASDAALSRGRWTQSLISRGEMCARDQSDVNLSWARCVGSPILPAFRGSAARGKA